MPELVCAADSPDWLTERRKGVTATDITAITGLSPYESAYSLFFKKRGDIPDEHTDNDRMRLGRELQPIIVRRFIEETGRDTAWHEFLWRSSERPWQLATPDCAVAGDNDRGEPLKVKSWADMDRDRWADGPPARVRAQVLWQMDTLDVATGHVGVLFLPSGEFRSYVIAHEDTYAGGEWGCNGDTCQACTDQRLLREAGRDFMDRLDTNQPPSPDASSATLAALKARFTDIHHDKTAEIDGEAYEAWSIWKAKRDEADAAIREAEALIREQAGEARTLTVNGTPVATRVIAVQNVKAHTRHMDYIRRATSKGESDA